MSTELLDNLCAVPNVRGASLFTDSGLCLEHRLTAPYAQEHIAGVLKDLVVAFESYRYMEPASVSLALARASDGVLAFMSANQFRVLALADTGVNLAFIQVAFGALRNKLETLDASSISHVSGSDVLQSADSHLSIDASKLGKISNNAPVNSRRLKRVIAAFTEFAGPAARLVVKQELKALGATAQTMTRPQFDQLIQRLSARLATDEQRNAFSANIGPS